MSQLLHRLADRAAAMPLRMAVILTLAAAASAVLPLPPSQAEAKEALEVAAALVQRVVVEPFIWNHVAADRR